MLFRLNFLAEKEKAMKEMSLQSPLIIEKSAGRDSDNYQKRLNRWTLAFCLSIGGGIIAGLTGLVLGAISYLGIFQNADAVNQTGNLLIIAAFPLMMFGAHTLDKINAIKISKVQDAETRTK